MLVRSFFCHALEEEVDGRGIGDVQGRRGASTANEVADASAMTEPESPFAEMAPDTSFGKLKIKGCFYRV